MRATPEHLLGYRADARWLGMSDYLVHFTPTKDAFVSILVEGRLRASRPFGWDCKVDELRSRYLFRMYE